MGQFNALIAVKSAATYIEANLSIELERVLAPWKTGPFDWYAIGVTDWHFAAYLHPNGEWIDDGPIDPAAINIPDGYVLVPIRCHG